MEVDDTEVGGVRFFLSQCGTLSFEKPVPASLFLPSESSLIMNFFFRVRMMSTNEYWLTRLKALPRVLTEWVHYDNTRSEEPVSVDGRPVVTLEKDDEALGCIPAETKKSISDLRQRSIRNSRHSARS